MGYVKLNELFEAFQMKKELARDLERSGENGEILDSLRSSPEGDREKEKLLKGLQRQKRQQRTRRKQKASALSARVWDRLEQYIKEYGREHDYKFIHGMKGDGALLYGKEGVDITKEVLEYANARYGGKKEPDER